MDFNNDELGSAGSVVELLEKWQILFPCVKFVTCYVISKDETNEGKPDVPT